MSCARRCARTSIRSTAPAPRRATCTSSSIRTRFPTCRCRDRREDFRTEILGLMKAQNVKNTIIVPVGAKGGFVVKRPPAGSRDELQAEVIACYQSLIRGMLDVTDNIVGNRIVPPPQVMRRDGDDT